MVSEDHVLTAEKAFVCLTLFDIIRMPLAMLPLLIVYMIEVMYIQTVETFFRKCMQKQRVSHLILSWFLKFKLQFGGMVSSFT